VEAVGNGVTRFRPGDEVYGDVCDMDGAFAEYVCVPDGQVEHKPANLSFEQAAAVPMAGCTALVGLRDVARVTAGQRILINGASGGVGTFAVQIAKAFGANVTAVCSTRNVDLVESLGADRVIDYTKADFARDGQRYHMVFDLVANRSLADLRRVLTAGGVLLLSGGGVSRNGRPHVTGPMGLQIKAQVASRFARHRLTSLMGMAPRAEHLATLRELIESGKVVPAIDRTFTLADVPEAIRYLEVEHARAKVVITV
jgi:NADPH:quinone reductase-like Zn-dependent oxidoreductase